MTDYDIPIIDTHQHFWDLANHRYPWLDPGTQSIVGDTSAIRKSFMPADYREQAVPLNIIGTVHLDGGFNPADPVGETKLAQRLHEETRLPSAVVAGMQLDAPDLEQRLHANKEASRLLRGVRHIIAWHEIPRLSYVKRPDIITDPLWLRGFASLDRYGLSADMQIYPSQMPAAAELAARTPGIPMIINQAGMPDGLVTGDHGAWIEGIRLLAQNRNVSIKISGFGMLKPDWNLDDIKPLVVAIIECFGVERVMLGSNYPVEQLFTPMPQLFAAYFECLAPLAPADIERVASGNAIRIYRVNDVTTDALRQAGEA